MAGFNSIFNTPLGQTALLFLLIFTIVFAILQKSEILGKGKKQIDALVALAIGLLVSGVGYVLEFTQKIIPFMAVVMIVILVMLILVGMFFSGAIDVSNKVRYVFSAAVIVIVLVAVMIFTGAWDIVKTWFNGSSNMASNIILIVIIVAVIAFAYSSKSGERSDKKN